MVLFLLNILNESKLPNVIHNSLNNSILSSSIPIDYYKKFVGIDFLNMKVKDIEHNYTSSKMDDSSFNAESSFPDHNLFLKIKLKKEKKGGNRPVDAWIMGCSQHLYMRTP